MSHVQQGKHTQDFSLQVFLYKTFHSMFHTCDLVHLLSIEFVPCKLFSMLTISQIFYRMFEAAKEYTHMKRGTWFVA